MSNETFVVINNIELGEGAELINSLTDIARCAKTFVEDCIFAEAVIQTNLRFSNFIIEGNFTDLIIAIVRTCIVSLTFRAIGDDVGNEGGSCKVGMKASCVEGRSG